MPYRLIHVFANGKISLFFLWLSLYTYIHTYIYIYIYTLFIGFPGGSVLKNPLANAGDAGDMGLISGLGRSPGVGNGNPFRYSCLGNPIDRGAWRATVHGVANGRTWLSMRAWYIYTTHNSFNGKSILTSGQAGQDHLPVTQGRGVKAPWALADGSGVCGDPREWTPELSGE